MDLLDKLFALGGVFLDPDGFIVPYWYANWPWAERSPFDPNAHYEAIVVGPAPLHVGPDEQASIVGDGPFEIVKLRDEAAGTLDTWVQVETDEGLVGWIPKSWLRHPMDCLMGIQRDTATGAIYITGLYKEGQEVWEFCQLL